MSRIIQITAVGTGLLIGLDDKGTVWSLLTGTNNQKWRKVIESPVEESCEMPSVPSLERS